MSQDPTNVDKLKTCLSLVVAGCSIYKTLAAVFSFYSLSRNLVLSPIRRDNHRCIFVHWVSPAGEEEEEEDDQLDDAEGAALASPPGSSK